MKKFDCLTSEFSKQILLKDYGDSSKYAVSTKIMDDLLDQFMSRMNEIYLEYRTPVSTIH